MAAVDTVVVAASDFDTAVVVVDIEAAADFDKADSDKAAVDIEAVAGFDNYFDIVVEAAIEPGQYPKLGHIAALQAAATAAYQLELSREPLEPEILQAKK